MLAEVSLLLLSLTEFQISKSPPVSTLWLAHSRQLDHQLTVNADVVLVRLLPVEVARDCLPVRYAWSDQLLAKSEVYSPPVLLLPALVTLPCLSDSYK